VRTPGTVTPAARWLALVREDRTVLLAVGFSLASVVFFLVGPLTAQRHGVRFVTPPLAILLSVMMWRTARAPGQVRAAARFWRLLGLGLATFALGMLVDLVNLVAGTGLYEIGEAVVYPVAGVITIAALMAYPTVSLGGVERIRMIIDVTTVLLASATFVWFFLVSRRYEPTGGWPQISDGLVLPAIVLIAGFVIIRMMTSRANIISQTTMVCFVVAASCASTPIIIGADPDEPGGRLGSSLYVAGFLVAILGVAWQRRHVWVGPAAGDNPAPATWRRSFTALPYGAMLATLGLLLIVVRDALDDETWVVVVGVLVLCGSVIARQFTAIWENTRLLGANVALTSQLRHRAYHDHVTGLANRMLFTERVTAALAAGPGRTAVLFIDLDDFKAVNDTMGHEAGDELLSAVARRLGGVVPEGGCLGRLGGDEFAILVPPAPDVRAAAEGVATAIAVALRSSLEVDAVPVTVEASVGIAVAGPGDDAAALLRNADVAMYAAKNGHKGGWRFFEPAMLASTLRRHRMRAALSEAVIRGEFVVHYQPIIDLAGGTVHGAEALVRWRRPDGGLLTPAKFIPLAEETGLVAAIDQWVLRHACEQVGRWRDDYTGGRAFALHVNVSARQLHRPDLVGEVEAALGDAGLPAECLTLEITESGLGHDPEGAIARLGELGRIGVHLAIDDFGTGYSSLAYLRRMPVDVLKIDKTFTDELAGPVGRAPLAQAVIALADALGVRTVAEGIEHRTQAERLLDLGCQFGQGYHYGRPLPARDMEAMLQRLPRFEIQRALA
jgi:diguanylate cyclase (GGDEF)-like protein